MELNKELIAKAKQAKTPEELLCLAKENDEEMTEESAKAYFELLHPKTGEIADDELDNVADGCNKNDGRKIVSVFCICNNYACSKCGGKCIVNAVKSACCKECGRLANCTNCQHCSYEKGLWLCNFGR